jgi:hypothetical protein
MRKSRWTLAAVAIILVMTIPFVLTAIRGPTGPHAPPAGPLITPVYGAIVFVGAESGFAGETLARLESIFVGPSLKLADLAYLSEATTFANGSSIVVFNSDWLVGKVRQAALTDFFKAILPTQVKIVALGGPTSLLFDALQQARPGIFPEERNPGYDDPPLAGYRLRQAKNFDGSPYFVESILIGRPSSAAEAVDPIATWT